MFSSSEADMSRTTSSFLQRSPRFQAPNNYKVDSDSNFLKSSSKEFQQGGSDFYQAAPNQQTAGGGVGLARYRSAPSSFLAALLDSGATDNSSSGDESDAAMFSAFMNTNNNNPKSHNNSTTVNHHDGSSHQFQMKRETEPVAQTRPGFGNGAMGYEGAVNGGGGAIVGSYSVGMESHVNGNGSAGLMRQSSSPAGFFNGFGVMGDVGSYTVHNHSKANSSASGMSNHMSFSSGAASGGSRFMPSIPENGNDSIGARSNPEREAAFPHGSWNGSSFNSAKRNRDGELKMFSSFGALDNQNTETRKNSSGLVHHLSLPKSFESEKLLHFQQETVPCQIRAKRGCATHPRSIAERMRRTRISERMKKLQDLFPNMDKQTNTADMLDLAVEYIKDLQKQVQTLKDTRAKCVCPHRPQHSNSST